MGFTFSLITQQKIKIIKVSYFATDKLIISKYIGRRASICR